MLKTNLEEVQTGSCSPSMLSATETELRTRLVDKEQELCRAKEALRAMKADRERLKAEKSDMARQMQQLYATLESREEQLRGFVRNYELALAKERDRVEREKCDLRRLARVAAKDGRVAELEAELGGAKRSLAALAKEVPCRLYFWKRWDLRRRTRSQVAAKDGRVAELEAELGGAKRSLAALAKEVPCRLYFWKRWDLRRRTQEATPQGNVRLCSQMDMRKDNCIKELQAGLSRMDVEEDNRAAAD